jgi:hypothetical protein
MGLWHAHDAERTAALLAPDFVYTTPILVSLGIENLDNEGFLRRVWQVTSNSFPDTRVETKNMVAAGDQVVLEVIENGTMTRDIQWPTGVIPATNRSYSVPYVYFFTVNLEGLIASLRIISRLSSLVSASRRRNPGHHNVACRPRVPRCPPPGMRVCGAYLGEQARAFRRRRSSCRSSALLRRPAQMERQRSPVGVRD